ncbi:MAG: hypothetical protein LBP62_06295 [Clostridiales bacterium]|nr:hypothetical protein [Clostridiales bacterium]
MIFILIFPSVGGVYGWGELYLLSSIPLRGRGQWGGASFSYYPQFPSVGGDKGVGRPLKKYSFSRYYTAEF